MLLATVVEASVAVGATRSRNAKIERLAHCLGQASLEEVGLAVSWLSGFLRGGTKLGVGWSAVQKARPDVAAAEGTHVLLPLEAELHALAHIKGKGSTTARIQALRGILERATRAEQDFLGSLLVGELRQGALEGVMCDAVARAAGVDPASVRRALMIAGDVAAVAEAAMRDGESGLGAFRIEMFRPLKPMLASPAAGVGEAFEHLGEAALEHKLDGVRVQVHKDGDAVEVYTRRLHRVTAAVPEIVAHVSAMPARALILDGEAISFRADGRPRPFQETMRRFGRKLDVERLQSEVPLTPVFFDAIKVDDDDLLDLGGADRWSALASVVPSSLRIPHLVTRDEGEAERFLAEALGQGHEGLMAKSLAAPYAAGRRGKDWLKLKPSHTLDLVVLAAEWGHGRRKGFLSNLHLGARDGSGGFVMLGKTFKGLTDAMLAWQTEHLLTNEVGREGHVVHVAPELVVEIAFDDVQVSPHYPGGLALRFARVRAHRPEKPVSEADDFAAVEAIHRSRPGR